MGDQKKKKSTLLHPNMLPAIQSLFHDDRYPITKPTDNFYINTDENMLRNLTSYQLDKILTLA